VTKVEENLKADEFIINCFGLFWIYPDKNVMWISKNGNTLVDFDDLPQDIKKLLEKKDEVVWESKNIKIFE
jgi:hypothetical protein